MEDIHEIIDDQKGQRVIRIPAGDYSVDRTIELDGQVIVGDCMGTALHPVPGITVISIKGHPGKSRRWDAVGPPAKPLQAGVRELRIYGRRESQTGIITQGVCDNLLISNVSVWDCDGGGFAIDNGCVRESLVSNLDCLRCGSGDVAAVTINQRQAKGGDGSNAVYFETLRCVYSYGPAVRIWNDDSDKDHETVRNIRMSNVFLHMLPQDAPERFPLIVMGGTAPIVGITIEGHLRGDKANRMPMVKAGTNVRDFVLVGTHYEDLVGYQWQRIP